MQTAERIHVAPLGFEFDRILLPALEYSADRVVLLEYIASDIERPPYHDELAVALEEEGIDCERRECNIFDLYESVAIIAEIASEHRDHNVYVNLSSGSKITAIAGMIACMATRAAEPYYIRADTYTSDPHEPLTHGMEKAIDIPTYRMDRPERQEIEILEYIRSVKEDHETRSVVSKKDLLEFSEDKQLPFIENYQGDTTKGKYRLLKTHIVEPLTEKGYITVTDAGVRNDVSLTEAGRNTLRAFRYLLE
ncbi:HFX_2341 family transcriptional regulator domain-containing protein [Halomicrobium urmianum]|uniref:HFX_2341 family transcriptional regulator domain-containing protein n=1 Tax=Halomicrobium urmianum TaxID=1586233 RepID=UPI001CD9E60C|nr:DUF6293 family protein [Halomicrobium urmianum]